MNSQAWHKHLKQPDAGDLTNSSVCMLLQSTDGDAQTLTEVDLFISTQRIKVLNADSQVSAPCFCWKYDFSPVRTKAVFPETMSQRLRGMMLCHNCQNNSLTADTSCILQLPQLWLLFNLMTSLCEFFLTVAKNRFCKAKRKKNGAGSSVQRCLYFNVTTKWSFRSSDPRLNGCTQQR